MKRKDTAGWERISLAMRSLIAAVSAAGFFKNFRRTGALKNRSFTVKVVPSGQAAS